MVKDGDIISIDIPNGRLELKVSDEELAKRREGFVPKEPNIKDGVLKKYSRLVTSASTGAVLNA